MKNTLVILLFSLLVIACDQKDAAPSSELFHELNGTWLLTERGWSPGSGYTIEPVSPNPPQTISFSGHKVFSSNVEGFSDFKYFAIVANDSTEIAKLHLYVEDPDAEAGKPAFEEFMLEMENGTLKVMQIGCIEGCHLGFRKDVLGRE